ncbi:putative lysophosphatidylglycerol acyltransferase 1-like isoform 1 [Operophtera brumata]|uniref:Putative lysophosphatidylglycerol acyltransferase 1-like isoform 1 n=1 Tax=Operophtera brumata TaxID=104452 RepID=A0A0L7KQI6_OPEBR|nr:putative lysophosphatidylglycerol acyltransferase 1-like isoform 1 [Operophtera brumata]
MLMAAWNPRANVLPNLMWIMDRVFKFTNFGIVSVLHEDFFIQAVLYIVESGDEPAACYGRRTLVLANHQSTADVPMLMAAWNPRANVLPNLMWIMDRVFKFTNFGIVSVLHEDFFIQAVQEVSATLVMRKL